MPRGSTPGERRGGRQRGTPNKKTLIKNAVFLAAAADPNRSPLDFMLALMRDSQVPLDLRIDVAAAAAPFVHARPEPAGKKGPDPLDLRDRLGETGELKFASVQAQPSAEGSEGLSPVDFLLGAMADPAATPRQRVKAAATAARYKHAHGGGREAPTVMVVEDKFGFKVDPELARAERDDSVRETRLGEFKPRSAEGLAAAGELEKIRKRRVERLALVKFPENYSVIDRGADQKRLGAFYSKRLSRKKLTPEEEAEEAHLAVRVLNPKAKMLDFGGLQRRHECESEWECPMSRMAELEERFVIGETPLTTAEQDELNDLRGRFPKIAAEVDRLDHRYRYWLRREIDVARRETEKRLHRSVAVRTAQEKCAHLRDPSKIVDITTNLYELEKRRFVEKLTPVQQELLEELTRRCPEQVEKTRKLVTRRLTTRLQMFENIRRTGGNPFGPGQYDPSSWWEEV